ncbi:MAG TPA: C40 family peptidase [Fimbriimonadaceae bacterium]|nr:C40 family peptidase [Fimbriimonadaceae bacterium]
MRSRLISILIVAVLSVSALAENKVVLGKLGQALEETKIFSKPSSSSRVYYKVKPYQYLVIKDGTEKYHKVLLQNGQYGFVNADVVARLPYDVTADTRAPSSRASGGEMVGSPSSRAAIANYSLKFTGTPYVWGGNDPRNGIDCSAFVKYLYGQIGVSLPRTAAEQVRVGKKITRLEELQAGDRLYFWSSKRNKIGHTGIYLGNGWFQHSSTNNRGVKSDYLSKKWLDILVAARR